jgi:FMN reductase
MNGCKIVGLGGSLAAESTSLAALKIALQAAEEAGAEVELFDVRTIDLPVFQPDMSNANDAVYHFVETVFQAQGMIWSSPLYHGTVSGSFKNALDWLELLKDREPAYLTDKIIGLISTAGGTQGLQAINTMEFIVRALRGWAVPLVIPIARAWKVFDDEGQPLKNDLTNQLGYLGQEVVRAARQFADEGACDYSQPSGRAGG